MSTIKNLATAAMLTASVAATKAQQVLKDIKQGTNNELIVTFYSSANGTTPSDIQGSWNKWIDEGATAQRSDPIWYDENTGTIFNTWVLQNPSTTRVYETRNNENVSNWTLNYPNQWRRVNLAGLKNSTGTQTLNINITHQANNANINTNWAREIATAKFTVANTLNDGSPIPAWTRIILRSRNTEILPSWWLTEKTLWRRHNGIQWIPQTNNPFWVPFDTVSNIPTLGTDETNNTQKAGIAYPNPTSNELYINDGDTQSGESFEYVIYDVSGRQVGNGKAREDQPITLEKNKSGMYFISTQDKDGDRTSHKIIKK